jgi:tRNA U34 2-thiouridine synthase MnmA/TrmU
MDGTPQRIQALSLLSGGLDSQLAICTLKEQGIDVHGVVFSSPFFEIAAAKKAAAALDVPLYVIDFSRDIVDLLKNPKHGFGSCMNPCIDCHAGMLRRAGDMMEEMGFHFLSTGEVLNERPMSQNKRALSTVAAECGYGDVLVRPLSARRLPETVPEKRGWVDRKKLHDLEGRSRKPQFALAERYGITEYPSPAGGCRLTEPNFSERLKDLKEHEGLNGVRSLELLKYGRHFRLAPKLKIVVGRHERDNAFLEGTAELYELLLQIEGFPGPTGLVPYTASEEQVLQGARICLRYSDCPAGKTATVRVRSSRGMHRIETTPAAKDEAEALRI